MKKIILFLFIFNIPSAQAFVGGGIISPPNCVTGFSRTGVNYCGITDFTYINQVALSGICQKYTPSWNVISGPTNAKYINGLVILQSLANGATGLRSATITFYGSDSSCSATLVGFASSIYEMVATTANTVLLKTRNNVVMLPSNPDGSFYYTTSGGNVFFTEYGYYQ